MEYLNLGIALFAMIAAIASAISAFRSETVSKQSLAYSKVQSELQLLASYPVLAFADLSIHRNVIFETGLPQNPKVEGLWIGLTVVNIGRLPCVIRQMELAPVGGKLASKNSLSRLEFVSNEEKYSRNSGPVKVEPGNRALIGAHFPEIEIGKIHFNKAGNFEVRIVPDSTPPIEVEFSIVENGGIHTKSQDFDLSLKNPVSILKDWLKVNS